MKMSAKTILKKCRKIISKSENWCKINQAQKVKSENEYGYLGTNFTYCGVDDPLACQWCASGAMVKAIPKGRRDENLESYNQARRALDMASGAPSIVALNDHSRTTHDQVIAAFDRAIIIVNTDEVKSWVKRNT